MVANASSHFDALTQIENKVATYCDGNGINVMLKPFYMSLCRKVYMLMNKHTGTTLHDEFCFAVRVWDMRGLTEATCIACHNEESPTFKSFNFEEKAAEVAHPRPAS